jgi:hypothetical protein
MAQTVKLLEAREDGILYETVLRGTSARAKSAFLARLQAAVDLAYEVTAPAQVLSAEDAWEERREADGTAMLAWHTADPRGQYHLIREESGEVARLECGLRAKRTTGNWLDVRLPLADLDCAKCRKVAGL